MSPVLPVHGASDCTVPCDIADDDGLEIDRILTLSTAHLSETTATTIATNKYSLTRGPMAMGLDGWLFYVPEDAAHIQFSYRDAPKELVDILLFAHKHKCAYCRFDSDGLKVKGLWVYEW